MKVLIDDIRTIDDVKFDIIARNFAAGMLVMESGAVTTLYLDHDLGDEHSGTGYDILQICKTKRILPENIHLITMNPVGLKNMQNFLRDNNYTSPDGYYFYKRKQFE